MPLVFVDLGPNKIKGFVGKTSDTYSSLTHPRIMEVLRQVEERWRLVQLSGTASILQKYGKEKERKCRNAIFSQMKQISGDGSEWKGDLTFLLNSLYAFLFWKKGRWGLSAFLLETKDPYRFLFIQSDENTVPDS